MKAESRFSNLNKDFWANVRIVSEERGYTTRGAKNSPEKGLVLVPSLGDIRLAFKARGLDDKHLTGSGEILTPMGHLLLEYYKYRAGVLNSFVEKQLMDVQRAEQVFDKLKAEFNPSCPIPMNKQKGEKKKPSYLTAIVNMLIEAYSDGFPCDYDPRRLITILRENRPLRTLSRRFDGAFPSTVNPIAVWEVKEYYYTTTFGSRVADGIYETLLDGMELEELRNHEGIEVRHYLMVDAHYTWWKSGKSYLCRIIDMLHMGYVDEILFGYEVVERLPGIVKDWVEKVRA